MSNRSREPTMECRSDVVAAATRKGSCSSPEKKESMKKQMDHDVFVPGIQIGRRIFLCQALLFLRSGILIVGLLLT